MIGEQTPKSSETYLDISSRVKPEQLGQTLVVLAGQVGSHKFDLGERLKDVLKTEMVAFVDYLLQVVRKHKLDDDYKTLQDLGLQTIREAGWQRYCHMVISQFPQVDSLVVDGLRHVMAVRNLRQFARPRDVFVVYVEATKEQQVENLRWKLESKGRDPRLIPSIMNHPVEQESGLVRYLADTRVESEGDRDKVIGDIRDRIDKKRAGEREWIFRRVNVSSSEFDIVLTNVDRYESLREVVRLLSAVAGESAALDAWLSAKKDGLHGRSPWETLLYGNPEDAIREALATIERI